MFPSNNFRSLSTILTVFCWLGVSAVLSEGFVTARASLPNYVARANQAPAFLSSKQQTSLNLVNSISRGGVTTSTTSSLKASTSGTSSGECPFTKTMTAFGSIWGSMGVVYILAKAIKRVAPIALEPFAASSTMALSSVQWSLYALSCLFFAYAEGYKGFHLKFAPLVVKRSFTLIIGTPHGNNPLNYLLAPLYSMGLWNATRKRLVTSWGISLGVAGIVALVKRLPPVPRCLLDAGVVVGLTLGSLSILYHYARSMLTGTLPEVDACLPNQQKSA
jgi:hypothetical protein